MQNYGTYNTSIKNGGTNASNKYDAANNLSVMYMDTITNDFINPNEILEVGSYKALVKYNGITLIGNLYVFKPNQVMQIFYGTNDVESYILYRSAINNDIATVEWKELNSSTMGDIGDGGDVIIDPQDIIEVINFVIPNTNQMADKAQLASKAVELANIVNLQVNLENTNPEQFNGSSNATNIGIAGVLPRENGGNGGYYLGVEEIDGELVPYIEFGGE